MEGFPYNVKIFNYEDCRQVRIYEKTLYTGGEKEQVQNDDKEKEKEVDKERSDLVSRNRTIQNMYGITRANRWDWFVTFTFDPNKLDSTNLDIIAQKTKDWLNNLKKRYCPDMIYIIVPELHKDGKKWHLHGLLANCEGLTLHDSGIEKKGKKIYNVNNWKWGFSTATKVENTGKVSRYITKYITKELCNMITGKKRYWASRNCLRMNEVSEVDWIEDTQEFLKANADKILHMQSKTCPVAGQKITYVEMDY